MNTRFACSLLAAITLCSLGLAEPATGTKESCATVVFQNPENYTDVKDSMVGTEKGRDHYLSLLRKVVEEEAGRLLPAGQKLTMTFTDIDLAGDYLPSMPAAADVRVIKDIYVPRMKFSYAVTDATGAVVKEGEENLVDHSFLLPYHIDRSDELVYDKSMLREWLRKTLR